MAEQRLNLHPDELTENKERIRLIWLDININNSHDSIQIQKILLEWNTAALFYTELDQCITAIESIKNEQILFIISGSFAKTILPKIQNIRSIIAIYIFCDNQQDYVSLMNEYNKIEGIYTDQKILLESVRPKLNLLERQAMTFSLFDQKQKSSRVLSKESISFLWHQIIIHVLKQMPSNDQSKQDFINKCQVYYQFDQSELKNIDEFKNNYCRGKAIEWYTKESFVYKLLNKALRTEDIELIYSFRFFIIDLCGEIEEEYFKRQHHEVVKVYRGQAVSIEELNKWKKNLGTIISFNSFFSTSLDMNLSLEFACQDVTSNDIQRILFEIEIDPLIKTAIYADISHKAQYGNEQEILFDLNSLFEIKSIDIYSKDNNIWKIQLKTTDKGADNVEQYLKSIQQQINESSPSICFGWLLLNEFGQVNQAEKYFKMLLTTLPSDHEDIAAIYNGIGCVHSRRNALNLALEYYEKTYALCGKREPFDHRRMTASLHNIANIHKDKRNFEQALNYYQKILQLEEKYYPDDHLRRALIIQNIGRTLIEKGDFDTAFNHLSSTLKILQDNLPVNDHKISICLGDIGLYWEKKGDLKKSLDYYQQELEMDELCLPPDHPYFAEDIKKIAVTYKENGEIEKALDFCREKLDEQTKMHGKNHPRIPQILMTMGKVLEKTSLSKSLKYYEEALDTLKSTIPIDYRAMAKCRHCIGHLCGMHEKFPKALEYLHKALVFYRELLPSDHIDIAIVCENIGLCYKKTNKSSEALDYFNKSLSIYRANNRSDDENVKLIENDIAKLNSELLKENVNDEELVIVTIDPDSHLSEVKSASIPKLNRNEIKTKTKTSRKNDLCPNCQIL